MSWAAFQTVLRPVLYSSGSKLETETTGVIRREFSVKDYRAVLQFLTGVKRELRTASRRRQPQGAVAPRIAELELPPLLRRCQPVGAGAAELGGGSSEERALVSLMGHHVTGLTSVGTSIGSRSRGPSWCPVWAPPDTGWPPEQGRASPTPRIARERGWESRDPRSVIRHRAL